jgi:hypothetical protein
MGAIIIRLLWACMVAAFIYESYMLWMRPEQYVAFREKTLARGYWSRWWPRGPLFYLECWLIENDLWIRVRRVIVPAMILGLLVMGRWIWF